MKKCKGCEFLKIEKPDGLNVGYARCTKHEVSNILIGRNYMQKVKMLDEYDEQIRYEFLDKVADKLKDEIEKWWYKSELDMGADNVNCLIDEVIAEMKEEIEK